MPVFLDPGLVLPDDSDRSVRPLRLRGEEYIGPPVRSPIWGGLAGLLEAVTAGAKQFDKWTTPGDRAPVTGLAGLWRVLGGQAAGEAAARKSEGGRFLAPAGGALQPDSMPLPTRQAVELGLAAAPLVAPAARLMGGLAGSVGQKNAVIVPLSLAQREKLPINGQLQLPTGELAGAVSHEPAVSLPAVADTGPGFRGQLGDLLPELAQSRLGQVRVEMPKDFPAGNAAFNAQQWRMLVSPHGRPLDRLGMLHHEASHAAQSLEGALGQGGDPAFIPHNYHKFRSGLAETLPLLPAHSETLTRGLAGALHNPYAAYTRDLGEVTANIAQHTAAVPEPSDLLLGLAGQRNGLADSTVFLQTPRGGLVLLPSNLLQSPSVLRNGRQLATADGRPLGSIIDIGQVEP